MRLAYKRILAFLIDMLLLMGVLSMVSQIDYLNPYKYKYEKAAESYNEAYQDSYKLFLENNDIKILEEIQNNLSTSFYNLSESLLFEYIWYIVLYFGYFVLFAYYTGGQTLGKKILKLKITNRNDEKVSFKSLCVRALFNSNNLFLGVNIVIILSILATLLIKNKIVFLYTASIITLLGLIFEMINGLFLLIRKDNKSLHDIISKTKVINY